MSSDIKAGRAYVQIGTNDSEFVKGMNAVSARLKKFSSEVGALGMQMAAAGAAILAPLTLATKQFIDTGDQLAKMAEKTGVGVTALSELAFQAKLAGADIGSVQTGFRAMANFLGEAANGGDAAAATLGRLGLNVKALLALSPEQRFDALRAAIAGISDPTLRSAEASKVFGKSAQDLLPLFAMTTEQIAKSKKEALEWGGVWSKDMADSAERGSDNLDRISFGFKGIANAIGMALEPALDSAMPKLKEFFKEVRDFVSSHGAAVVAISKIAVGLAAVGTALIAISVAAKVARTAMLAASLAMATGPIGAAIAAATLLVYGLAKAWDHARESAGRAMAEIRGDVGGAAGGHWEPGQRASMFKPSRPPRWVSDGAKETGGLSSRAEIMDAEVKFAGILGNLAANLKAAFPTFFGEGKMVPPWGFMRAMKEVQGEREEQKTPSEMGLSMVMTSGTMKAFVPTSAVGTFIGATAAQISGPFGEKKVGQDQLEEQKRAVDLLAQILEAVKKQWGGLLAGGAG